jgi:hypothetical protein
MKLMQTFQNTNDMKYIAKEVISRKKPICSITWLHDVLLAFSPYRYDAFITDSVFSSGAGIV